MTLRPCPRCQHHHDLRDGECPECGAPCSHGEGERRVPTLAAALLGLALAGCAGDGKDQTDEHSATVPQDLYGVAVTHTGEQ